MKYKLHMKQNNESEVNRQLQYIKGLLMKSLIIHDIVGLHLCSFLEYFSIGFS